MLQLTLSARMSVRSAAQVLLNGAHSHGANVIGPPAQHKMCLFIDDLNLPLAHHFGAQPVLEWVRTIIEHSGWHPGSGSKWVDVASTNYIGAMGPPGSGRSHISPRVLRHFVVHSLASP